MAFALSAALNKSVAFRSFSSLSGGESFFFFLRSHPRPSNLALRRISSSLVFSRRRNHDPAITSSSAQSSSSSSRKSKRNLGRKGKEEEEIDEDAFEALFSMLEEDLKNDELSVVAGESDEDDDEEVDMSEEDLEKLQRELEEALGVGGDDDDDVDVEMLHSVGDIGEDDDDEEGGDEERPLKLKNWQLRRLAWALKTGRRKTSIKGLAAELCLDRAIVLELLRDPPPNLVMMSAALPDKPTPVRLVAETKPIESISLGTTSGDVDAVSSKSEMKVPVHVLQHRWFVQKRLKKVHIETLERVYKRTRRPTNAMISSIVHVTNLPRKRVVKWFEDKRTEDGVPDSRLPYRRSVPQTASSSRDSTHTCSVWQVRENV